jgi:hypothetical protein
MENLWQFFFKKIENKKIHFEYNLKFNLFNFGKENFFIKNLKFYNYPFYIHLIKIYFIHFSIILFGFTWVIFYLERQNFYYFF